MSKRKKIVQRLWVLKAAMEAEKSAPRPSYRQLAKWQEEKTALALDLADLLVEEAS
jgi:hypothetical protein